ncbi:glycoside hydrolase family 114 protein [Piromyces sp. E2]|nr:glycoside hydrolase family 114 protein [Piromyces sp. E2]|eukprot:OUM60986.1 glycoside hydrolase family 114 protein [Piromyces sp. E2]
MKFVLPITFIVTSLLASNIEAKWHPNPGLSWDYLLGASDSVIKSSNKQVVTIDLEQAPGLVSYLHGKGQKVICYFSGGTMQKSRKIDYDDYKPKKLQPLIRNRMKRAKSYGCDAVEVDSLGLYVHHIGDYTKEDTITFGKWLAETAHEEDISIGLKNVAGCAKALESSFDFAVVESCAESENVCKIYEEFTKHNKAVFTVHYGNRKISKDKLKKELGGYGFTCAYSINQELNHNSSNFDCSKGNVDSDIGSKPTVDKKTTTTTTTVTKTTTATVKVNPTENNTANAVNTNTATGATGAAGAAGTAGTTGATGAAGAAGAAGANTSTKQPLSNITNNGPTNNVVNEVSKEEGSGVGIAVSIAAVGGVATAAVAGFIFLKKNKKFTSSDEEYSLGY